MSLCNKMARRLCLLVVILFLFQMGIYLAVANNNIPNDKKFSGIDFKDGLLKVSVEKESFKEVIDKVAKKTGIKILIDSPYDEKVSISFDYLPLEKGLRQLLREKNYAFTYQSEENDIQQNSSSLMKVFVFSRSEGGHLSKSEVLAQGDHPDNARQALDMNEIQNQIKEKLDEVLVLQDVPQSGLDIAKRFREAMDEIKEMEGIFEEKAEFKDVAGIEEQIKEALQVIQDKGNIITK